MKIAVVCDWLTGMRGGERCLEAVSEIFPDSDIFTLVYVPGSVSQKIESHKITTSYIQSLPGATEHFRRYLPLFPHAIRKFNLGDFDCVLSFSHCVAKSVKAPPAVPHICYCHTPMRYAWHMLDEYLSDFGYLKKSAAKIVFACLRRWDKKTSAGVTHFVANSKNVQNRLKDCYNRDSVVIYPPVDCDRFTVSNHDDGFYLIVSALVPYKRVGLAVAAFRDINRRLVVVGNGPQLNSLKKSASPNVSFIESADDAEVVEYMQKCTALIFPGEEDFGIVPLEAQACGKPVIAFGKGGVLETVTALNRPEPTSESPTGLFFYRQAPESLSEAIASFENSREQFTPDNCRQNALAFDRQLYQKSMQSFVQTVLSG
jgi:glycosyltransferase involved in cell wall biosynthesis